jgi:hypothetical protein|tara:strand:- start:50 stop:232 length:183 start_codon:yes stop_codon:yes gene_type:complete
METMMATQLKENTHADDDAFRTEVHEFLSEKFPQELKSKVNLASRPENSDKRNASPYKMA